ncbi:hypothetical protein GPECTOR_102g66 [Gonium pectorale]|uniref:Uncharacterized protein n=1 Tax=Gonium pectorale TaxID=33097 RepID=A0A150FZR6_GONPE|nr:hypothetical protein GPECTOR_102g66 [Gonium pectorale]|eukprot:KXZ43113.1 hypothetical protein GPECTOR_102g66 [Gonium pectorale]
MGAPTAQAYKRLVLTELVNAEVNLMLELRDTLLSLSTPKPHTPMLAVASVVTGMAAAAYGPSPAADAALALARQESSSSCGGGRGREPQQPHTGPDQGLEGLRLHPAWVRCPGGGGGSAPPRAGVVLFHRQPLSYRHSRAVALRSLGLLSHLDSAVTLVACSGRVVFQNAASRRYHGRLLGLPPSPDGAASGPVAPDGTPLRRALTAAEVPVPWAGDLASLLQGLRAAHLLQRLFSCELQSLEDSMLAAWASGRHWKRLLHVPPPAGAYGGQAGPYGALPQRVQQGLLWQPPPRAGSVANGGLAMAAGATVDMQGAGVVVGDGTDGLGSAKAAAVAIMKARASEPSPVSPSAARARAQPQSLPPPAGPSGAEMGPPAAEVHQDHIVLGVLEDDADARPSAHGTNDASDGVGEGASEGGGGGGGGAAAGERRSASAAAGAGTGASAQRVALAGPLWRTRSRSRALSPLSPKPAPAQVVASTLASQRSFLGSPSSSRLSLVAHAPAAQLPAAPQSQTQPLAAAQRQQLRGQQQKEELLSGSPDQQPALSLAADAVHFTRLPAGTISVTEPQLGHALFSGLLTPGDGEAGAALLPHGAPAVPAAGSGGGGGVRPALVTSLLQQLRSPRAVLSPSAAASDLREELVARSHSCDVAHLRLNRTARPRTAAPGGGGGDWPFGVSGGGGGGRPAIRRLATRTGLLEGGGGGGGGGDSGGGGGSGGSASLEPQQLQSRLAQDEWMEVTHVARSGSGVLVDATYDAAEHDQPADCAFAYSSYGDDVADGGASTQCASSGGGNTVGAGSAGGPPLPPALPPAGGPSLPSRSRSRGPSPLSPFWSLSPFSAPTHPHVAAAATAPESGHSGYSGASPPGHSGYSGASPPGHSRVSASAGVRSQPQPQPHPASRGAEPAALRLLAGFRRSHPAGEPPRRARRSSADADPASPSGPLAGPELLLLDEVGSAGLPSGGIRDASTGLSGGGAEGPRVETAAAATAAAAGSGRAPASAGGLMQQLRGPRALLMQAVAAAEREELIARSRSCDVAQMRLQRAGPRGRGAGLPGDACGRSAGLPGDGAAADYSGRSASRMPPSKAASSSVGHGWGVGGPDVHHWAPRLTQDGLLEVNDSAGEVDDPLQMSAWRAAMKVSFSRRNLQPALAGCSSSPTAGSPGALPTD